MYITNVKIPFMKPMMEKGFTSEIGISMVVQRAARDTIDTGTNWGKAAELNREVDKTPLRLETESIYRQIPGNVMSYEAPGVWAGHVQSRHVGRHRAPSRTR